MKIFILWSSPHNMEHRRRVNAGQAEVGLVREAHLRHPDNSHLRYEWIVSHPGFRGLRPDVQALYQERRRGMRRVRDLVRRELDE